LVLIPYNSSLSAHLCTAIGRVKEEKAEKQKEANNGTENETGLETKAVKRKKKPGPVDAHTHTHPRTSPTILLYAPLSRPPQSPIHGRSSLRHDCTARATPRWGSFTRSLVFFAPTSAGIPPIDTPRGRRGRGGRGRRWTGPDGARTGARAHIFSGTCTPRHAKLVLSL